MPFLIVIAAGYQSVHRREAEKEATMISISKERNYNHLTTDGQQLSSMGISAASVFDGNYKDVVPYLESRGQRN
jgi:hypothetical protein